MNIEQRRLGLPRLSPSCHRASGARRPRRWNPGHTPHQDRANQSHKDSRALEHRDVMFQKRAHSRPAQQSTGNCAAVNSSDVGLLALQSVPPHGKHDARVGLQPWPPPSLATHALAQFPEQPPPVLAACHLPRIRHQVCSASAPSL